MDAAAPAIDRQDRAPVAGTTVAQVVGHALGALGVDTVFGLIGSGNAVATNALVAAGARYFAARHEAGATGMADGWARTTGRVGVVSVHQGPGLTNTLTALTEAVKSRTPLVVLAGETPAGARRSNFRIDQHGLVEAVGAVADRVHGPASAAADAARALRRAEVERRPVVLMLPIDLQTLPVPDGGRLLPPWSSIPATPAPRPAAVAEAAEILRDAQRPLLIGGRGAVLADAGPDIAALAARAGALLATSAVAKGLFAGDPFDLGISGGFASPVAAELIAAADVVISFGATLNHWTTRHRELIGDGTRVVQVDLDPDAIGANLPVALGIVGDTALTAQALLAQLERGGDAPAGWRTPELAPRIARGHWRHEPYAEQSTAEHIDPRTLGIALADALGGEVAVAVDSGHFQGYPSFYLDVPDARSWLFINAFQAVGLALGPAIGGAVARPDRVMVAVLGDGGAFLSLAEIETAARFGVRLLVAVYDDAAYGAEVHHFGPMGEDLAPVRFPDADLARIARAAGAAGMTVRSIADLGPLHDWLRNGSGPMVLDAKVNPAVCADWLTEAFRAG
ncbi:MAG: thiamine pyrophosphate-binding protein [Solirubrobacterales bacterium]|nr:thiamine pyrophosphate-binding protein [Solirubrobacterales bacterium]